MKKETCLQKTNQWSITAKVYQQVNIPSLSALKLLKDGQQAFSTKLNKKKESSSII